VVLLESHGLITLGGTSEAVLAAMLMAEKTAQIWLGVQRSAGQFFYQRNKLRAFLGGRMKPGGESAENMMRICYVVRSFTIGIQTR